MQFTRALNTASRSIRTSSRHSPTYLLASSSRVSSLSRFSPLPSRFYSTEKPAEEASNSSSADSSPKTEDPNLTAEQKALQAKDAEIAELKSRLQYSAADYQNLQRISEREKQQAKDFAISRFAKDLLQTVDVLSIALKSVPEELRVEPSPQAETHHAHTRLYELFKGVEITERQLLQTLSQHGIVPYDPLGETFDPNAHEALFSAPRGPKGDEAPGTIINVQKLGYTIKGRTLRAPQVGIVQDN